MNKFYVTTAIPYVNAAPHIGNVMDCIYADVLARYHRQSGEQVLFSTGVDEHGSKVAEKAKEAGKTPQSYADEVTEEFIKILKSLNISNDRFIRTSNQAHADRVQLIWQNLQKYIYKSKYVGLYCSGCEEFVTDTIAKANKGVCPMHNRQYEKLEEENYFFALSKFTGNIKKVIESGDFKILPEAKKHEILNLLGGGLEDISISRPSDKLVWGIAVPGDEKQVMYVWFDALLNYITLLGYPENKDFKAFWPADVQIIGKEIVRFHAAFWPAILMALQLPLPKLLYVHGHIGVDGKKMSKTLGNVVNPQDVIENTVLMLTGITFYAMFLPMMMVIFHGT
jgi:methionyl-tRNA synthetase